MRKTLNFRKLGRTSSHRKALLRNMATSLLLHEKVKTTVAKSKEVASFTERLITRAKKNDLAAKRYVAGVVTNKDVQKKLFDVLVPRYANRTSGYTKRYRLVARMSDGAEMALLKLMN
ncbi:MAG: 50S ribosomal protein L17 [Elusimicrobiota bacterium]